MPSYSLTKVGTDKLKFESPSVKGYVTSADVTLEIVSSTVLKVQLVFSGLRWTFNINAATDSFRVKGVVFDDTIKTAAYLNSKIVEVLPTAKTGRTAVANVAYTLLASDSFVAYTSLTATRAITLPVASTVPNQHFIIKDEAGTAAANNITLVGTVDGAVNPTAISANFGKYRLYSNGASWFSE